MGRKGALTDYYYYYNNNPGVCVKGADPAVLTGRDANGRNPTALLG
jgi:hypothetical protein